MNIYLTKSSKNRKVGPIPVSTSPKSTCPSDCPLRGHGCYAEGGPLSIHWRKVSNGERGFTWNEFCRQIAHSIPKGILWRHNQAGDLIPLENNHRRIDLDKLLQLVTANAHHSCKGFTYTHYAVLGTGKTEKWNRECISKSNTMGFIINLSSDSLIEADKKYDLNIAPVTVTLPSNSILTKGIKTPAGHNVIVCPVAVGKLESCAVCGLCAKQRKSIIGFPVHGFRSKQLDKILSIIEET